MTGFSPLVAQQPAEAKRNPVKIALVGGDFITGTVSGVGNGNVSVITDYGVIRIPVERLTDGSREVLGIKLDSNVVQLQKRITELEALVERLRAENAQLRRQPPPAPSTIKPLPGSGGIKDQGTTSPSVKAGGFWISSTGKRHNSRCRYHGTSNGRTGSETEGVACKICGG